MAKELTAEDIKSLANSVPKVEIKHKVVVESQIDEKDFDKINAKITKENNKEITEQPITEPQKQDESEITTDEDLELAEKELTADEHTNAILKIQKHKDIAEANEDIILDVENGNIEVTMPKQEQNEKTGEISETDADIMTVLHFLADENDANAQNILGVCYMTGINVMSDEEKAINYFENAAKQDYPVAQRNLAIVLENSKGPDNERIINLYEQAAKSNDAIALNNLGVCYMTGENVKQNIKTAVKYFAKAAKLGDDFAMVNLADCYAIGNGIHRNDKKAFTLYQQAAEKNNIDGIRNLADCYYNGIDTKQDFKEALKLYQKAADVGDNVSKEMLEKLQTKLSPQRHEISTGEISDAAKAVKKPTLADKLKMGEDISKTSDNTADKDKQTDKTQEQAAEQSTEQQSR